MSKYRHGIYVDEVATKLPAPEYATSGIQVVVGTAPVNLAADPYSITNVPVMVESMEDAADKLGYTTDFDNYTICGSMYASFAIAQVAPVVYINVLDPAKHIQKITSETIDVSGKVATFEHTGVLLDTLKVSVEGGSALTADTDYVATFNSDGYVAIGLTSTGAGASAAKLTVEGSSIDPSKVTAEDIIGGIDGDGNCSGIECVKKVYPVCQVIPATIIAPKWSEDKAVGAALMSHTKDINGIFHAYTALDLDTTTTTRYDKVADTKANDGYTSADATVLWPMVLVGDAKYKLPFSTVYAAGMQALDAANDDCPTRTPSNVDMGIVGTVLADGTEINLDQEEGNIVNASGVTTAIRFGGWKVWGVMTAAGPDTDDPKDKFVGVRRMFSWQANSFIVRYADRVDQNIDHRAIEQLVADENLRCNALAAQRKWAGGKLVFDTKENPLTSILAGKVIFHQHIAPYTPMKEINNTLEYSADILAAALSGGEE